MQSNETWGLVVGKFAPYHLGHRYLLAEVSKRCDNLIVLSYANPDFGFSMTDRYAAIQKDFPLAHCIFAETDSRVSPNRESVDALHLEMPHNDDCAYIHRAFCADMLLDEFPDLKLDFVFSSEDYGYGFAEYLSFRMKTDVVHVMIDKDRKEYPVSATKLRNGELEWNQWSLIPKA